MAGIAWEPLGTFGARVDLDLREPVSSQEAETLRAMLDEHKLLVFPGQSLDYDEQLAVSAWFGKAVRERAPLFVSPDPEIGGLGSKELAFHSDMSCCEPLDAISLHAVDVDDLVSCTRFVDAVGAAQALPEELRRRIRDLTALHLWPTMESSSERERGKWDIPDNWPGAEHPVLMTHPRTGKDILYVNASQTERIVELDPVEGEELIIELFGTLYDPQFTLEHVWKTGDFLVWDNLALQHGRPALPAGVTRNLQRVSIGNDPHGRNMPEEFRKAYGLVVD